MHGRDERAVGRKRRQDGGVASRSRVRGECHGLKGQNIELSKGKAQEDLPQPPDAPRSKVLRCGGPRRPMWRWRTGSGTVAIRRPTTRSSRPQHGDQWGHCPFRFPAGDGVPRELRPHHAVRTAGPPRARCTRERWLSTLREPTSGRGTLPGRRGKRETLAAVAVRAGIQASATVPTRCTEYNRDEEKSHA